MLTLLCPDALPEADDLPGDDYAPVAASPAPADTPLQRLLRRSELTGRWTDPQPLARTAPAHQWIASHLGAIPANAISANNWHPGAMRALSYSDADAQPPAPNQMVMTPAHLHAGLDHLVLQPPSALGITRGQAQALIDTTNRFFEADGLVLSLLSPLCWLMQSATRFDVQPCDHAMAVGRNIEAYLPDGPDARRLRSVLNEMQMLWHDHPVNQEREAQQQPSINTLWAEGYLPAGHGDTSPPPGSTVARPDLVISAEPVTRGLASFAGVSTRPPGDRLETEISNAASLAAQNTLLELPAGPASIEQVFRTHPGLNAQLVLTNSREWLQLRVSPGDRLRFWRHTRLSSAT